MYPQRIKMILFILESSSRSGVKDQFLAYVPIILKVLDADELMTPFIVGTLDLSLTFIFNKLFCCHSKCMLPVLFSLLFSRYRNKKRLQEIFPRSITNTPTWNIGSSEKGLIVNFEKGSRQA